MVRRIQRPVPKSKRAPAALAKRAEAAASAKLTRLVAEAKRDIALIQRRRSEIAEAFFDIGEALVRLKRREVILAMGCRTFVELCQRHIGLSGAQADRLVDIVQNMSREDAIRLGPTKAASVVALARATPADDTPADLVAHGVRVRGKKMDVTKASARAVASAVAEVRPKRTSKRGRSVSEAERARGEALADALHALGAHHARVLVKSGAPGAGARIAIECDVAELRLLAKALRSR